ncbi:MAG: DNA-binding protein [Nitrososphaerota archaeon]|nr:DNA-binding protein [Candidatus Calditenuaceae archaeon]MDW8072861.1 DNA-binding protein [Nitrososphaerota archaeon]
MPEDEELEEIRRRKMAELQAKAAEEEARRRAEAERAAVLRVVLTPEARQRLANIKMARPAIAEAVENYIVNLARSGNLKSQITDDLLRQILEKVMPPKKETKIVRLSKDEL